jgi:hypothetical protein
MNKREGKRKAEGERRRAETGDMPYWSARGPRKGARLCNGFDYRPDTHVQTSQRAMPNVGGSTLAQ